MEYIRKALCLISAMLWIVGPTPPARADESATAVMARLKTADDLLKQGRLEFERKTRNLTPRKSIEEQTAERRRDIERRGASREQIARSLPQFRHEAEFDARTRETTAKEMLVYAQDGRFLRETTSQWANEEVQTTQELWDGKDELLISPVSKEVSIHSERPSALNSAARMIGIYPGACFILGRGLSILENVHVQKRPGGLLLEGSAPDGSQVQAMIDPGHDYLAARIERRDRAGNVVARVLLGPPIRVTGGSWVASTANYEAFFANGQPIIKEEYEVTSADFTAPDDALLAFPIPQGWQIMDDRLGRAIVFKKTKPGAITAQDLLPFTNKEVKRQAALAARELEYEQRERMKRRVAWSLPFLLAGTIGAIIFVRRHPRQKVRPVILPR